MPKSRGRDDPEVLKFRQDVGARIEAARLKAGYTVQRRFCEVLGIAPSTLVSWEKGRASPLAENLWQISKITQETPAYFIPSRLRRKDSLETLSVDLGTRLGYGRISHLLDMPWAQLRPLLDQIIGEHVSRTAPNRRK